MSSFYFAAAPAAHAVSRNLIGSDAHDPVVHTAPRRRTPRTRAALSRSLHRLADSVGGA